MDDRLLRLLAQLEETVDLDEQAAIDGLHQRALGWEPVGRLPLVLAYPLPEDSAYEPYPHGEALDDPAKMLYNELVHAFGTSAVHHPSVGDDLPATIRANMGTGIVASLFGGRIQRMGDDPPWVEPLQSKDAYAAIIERDPRDYAQGWCPTVIERYRYYRETLADYSRLAGLVRLVLPDLQGPLDTVELLVGSRVYIDLYEGPEQVYGALEAVAVAQVGLAKLLTEQTNDGPVGMSHQHATAVRGNILIRNDSSILVSAKMYRELVAPHDGHVLTEMGGGGIHSCGRMEHLAAAYLSLPGIQCIDLGQPEMNDLDAIYGKAEAAQVSLVRVDLPAEQIASGEVMRRFPTGVSLFHQADTLAQAQEIMRAYRAATGA